MEASRKRVLDLLKDYPDFQKSSKLAVDAGKQLVELLRLSRTDFLRHPTRYQDETDTRYDERLETHFRKYPVRTGLVAKANERLTKIADDGAKEIAELERTLPPDWKNVPDLSIVTGVSAVLYRVITIEDREIRSEDVIIGEPGDP